MKLLIDTHVLLWSLFEPSLLSKKAEEVITNSSNRVYVSAVTMFEISLKFSIGKLDLKNLNPEDILNEAQQVGYELLPLSAEDASSMHKLELLSHKDPFDKILIWQAISNKFKFVSKDSRISEYSKYGLDLLW